MIDFSHVDRLIETFEKTRVKPWALLQINYALRHKELDGPTYFVALSIQRDLKRSLSPLIKLLF